MTDIVRVPFQGDELLTVEINGKPHVLLKPAFESIGLDADQQIRKVQRQVWARTVVTTVQVGDQRREMIASDSRTLLMALATIPASRVAESVRPKLIAYQSEVADVIDAYWTKGGAINPRATEDQLADIITQAEGQARVLKALQGIVHPDWLETQARLVAGRALGIEPEQDPTKRPLTVHDYLIGRGVSAKRCGEVDISFGGYLSRLFKKVRGESPTKVDRNVGGAIRPVCVYSERDRPLFDEVWNARFADAGLVGAA